MKLKPRRARGRELQLTGVLAVIIAIELALWFWSGSAISQAVVHFREGRYEAAAIHVERGRWLPLRRYDRDWVAVAANLALQRDRSGPLEGLRSQGRRFLNPLQRREVFEVLVRRGLFREALIWDSAAREVGSPDQRELLLRAAALVGAGRLDEGERALAAVPSNERTRSGIETLRRSITDQRRGIVPVVLDRNGKVLALWRSSDGALIVTEPAVEPVIRALAAEERISGWPTLHLTLDTDRQRLLSELLTGYRGTIAAMEPASGRVIAIVSSDGVDPLARVRIGSLGRLAVPLVEGVYPVTCSGVLRVRRGVVLDSGRHGLVPDHESALTWGCSVAAGQAAARAGREAVLRSVETLGLSADLTSDLELASIGSAEGTVVATPLDLASLAAAVGSDGVRRRPVLVERRTNILGEPLEITPDQVNSVEVEMSGRLREVLRRSVLESRGSAHLLAMEGIDAAATGGNLTGSDGRYSARMIGFSPLRNPHVAVAITIEDSGPARMAGARLMAQVLSDLPVDGASSAQ